MNQHDINRGHCRHRESNAVGSGFAARNHYRRDPQIFQNRGNCIELCGRTGDHQRSGLDVGDNLERACKHAGAVNVNEGLRNSASKSHAGPGRNDDDSDRWHE